MMLSLLNLISSSFWKNKSCFSFEAKKRLVAATFLSVLDYGDVLYMNASSKCLQSLDTVYHGALRFVTNFKTLRHHCSLYARVGWSLLSTRRLHHWHILIYKTILCVLPAYLQKYVIQKSTGAYQLRSEDLFYWLCLESVLNWGKGHLVMRLLFHGTSCKMR